MRLDISIKGRPAPQGSKRLGAGGALIEQSAYLGAWRAAVKIGAYRALQQIGIPPSQLPLFRMPLGVGIEECTFFVGSDQCRADGTDLPIGTPDIDKLLRSTLDALGGARRDSARIFADDSQVIFIGHLAKTRGDRPGAHIIISDGRE